MIKSTTKNNESSIKIKQTKSNKSMIKNKPTKSNKSMIKYKINKEIIKNIDVIIWQN